MQRHSQGEGVHRRDRRAIWLSIDDVEWAVKYLFTQNTLEGVPLVYNEDAGPGGTLQQEDILGKGGS